MTTDNHIDETSLKLTRAVNTLFALTRDAYESEFGGDSSHKRAFCRRVAEKYATMVGCKVVEDRPKPKPKPQYVGSPAISLPLGTSKQVETAISLAEEIIDLSESPDLPSAGIGYAESVADKARDIMESVESENRATGGQIEALENMLDGLQRWFRD